MSKRRNKRTPLTEDERKLLASYRELSPEDRRDLVGWAEHLALNTVRLNGIRDGELDLCYLSYSTWLESPFRDSSHDNMIVAMGLSMPW